MKSYTRLAIASALLVSLVGCGKIEALFKDENKGPQVAVPAKADGSVQMLLPDFTQLVEREGPAVVNIQAVRSDNSQASSSSELPVPVPEDDPFYEFFRRYMPNPNQPPDPQPSESISFGSGFILSNDGYILTNAHVVAGGSQIKVMLTDKRELRAKLVGLDKRTDVAVLKVEAASLPTVKIGSPSQLKVGEWVAAIGAPFGFENTVTAGIVSAKGRSLPDESYVPFIQTDVAINPGNSGGPLFNLRGEVVGINSQIYSRSGGFMGISFAIPIDIAMKVAEQLKSSGKVSRGQLGVHIQEVTQELAQSFGLDRPRGALVVRVEPNGPASRAGIHIGDIILRLNGQTVDNSRDLPRMVGDQPPGTHIKLGVWRKGNEQNVDATLAELVTDQAAQPGEATPAVPQSFQFGKLGLTLAELTADDKQTLGLHGGLVVQKAQGVAAQAGLTSGDVIIGLNQTEITSIKTFERALASANGNIALLVRRQDSTLFVPLRLN
ncbi:DegQ family serine endoprotease [Vogesella sp. LIG4]|uniref:DegQ family serine endoprotease n=1 Tax=Vogesella sp. LIG4 TaxID=1192162 RepID=UPI00081F91F4|nr:DegQ family serine endoprotease [Vogesella sp. LIG4]SCK30483.1 serine protease Do [Vogesella sp. LIG4]